MIRACRKCQRLLLSLVCALASFNGCLLPGLPAQDIEYIEPELIDQEPFDLIVLTPEEGGDRVKILPLPFRQMPDSPRPDERLEVVLLKYQERRYEIAWKSIEEILFYEQRIYDEAMQQMEMADCWPDVIVGCTGGGSNFAGIAFPFMGHALRGGEKSRIVAVEPSACPTLTRGKYAYDYGDTAHMTPLTKMHTLGSGFTPPGFHAGGLRYHGMAPLVSHAKELGLFDAVSYTQRECFEAGVLFAKNEGIVPAPEANHAVKGAIDEALRCKREGKEEVILFNLCGHGHFDMGAYDAFLKNELANHSYPQEAIDKAMEALPEIAM